MIVSCHNEKPSATVKLSITHQYYSQNMVGDTVDWKPNCSWQGAACLDPRFIGGDGIVFYPWHNTRFSIRSQAPNKYPFHQALTFWKKLRLHVDTIPQDPVCLSQSLSWRSSPLEVFFMIAGVIFTWRILIKLGITICRSENWKNRKHESDIVILQETAQISGQSRRKIAGYTTIKYL